MTFIMHNDLKRQTTVYKIFPLYCVFFFIGKERDFTDGGVKKIMVVL